MRFIDPQIDQMIHLKGFSPFLLLLLLRAWQADPSSGPLYLSSVSTEHPEVLLEGVRVHVHSCLYLLEPTGTRRTRLTHICQTDTRYETGQSSLCTFTFKSLISNVET